MQLTLAVRNLNGHQYLFHLVGGALLGGYSPLLDDNLTSANNPGIFAEGDNTPTSSNGIRARVYLATNVDWCRPR